MLHHLLPLSPGCRQMDQVGQAEHVRPDRGDNRPLHRDHRLRPLRRLCVRLRRADRLPARGQASGPDHCDHLAERQRLRGGLERRLEPHPRLLAGSSQANREGLLAFLKPETTFWEYTHGVAEPDACVSGRLHARQFLFVEARRSRGAARPHGRLQKQCRALPDFPELFPHPQAAAARGLGRNDPFFLPPGAEAFKRDIPNALVRFFDTGHFALETHAAEIAAAIRDFLPRRSRGGRHGPRCPTSTPRRRAPPSSRRRLPRRKGHASSPNPEAPRRHAR